MYVLKNAFKSISRSKGRNILIGIIVLVIAISTCLGLSIRQAANNAKEEALENLTITAQISVDRNSMMKNMSEGTPSGESETTDSSFDKSAFAERVQNIDSLSIDELTTYAGADSVSDFYYTLTVSMNGTDEFEPVDTSTDSEEESSDTSESSQMSDMPDRENMPGGEAGGKMGFAVGSMGEQGDFTVIGYSSDIAMTDFINGTCRITDGTMFEEGTSELNCVISDELASYNDLSVGDTITLTNPNDEEETYTVTIVGTYENSQSTVSSSNMMGGFSTSTDPANQIYLSYEALKSITTNLPEQISGTYVFASIQDYETFCEEVYDMGLSEDYIVSSSDVSNYEQSLLPLENLSQMALYFLIVVLGIGAVVLIVLNIFSVRERKYEVGVLTAIGMKKSKVSLQFMLETFVVTVIAIILGGIIGAASSVPVTNSLLASQIEAENTQSNEQSAAFGRAPSGGDTSDANMPGANRESEPTGLKAQAISYVSEVNSATDITVLLQLLGIGILLTVTASMTSIIFIMRYDPLKILSNRD